DSRRRGQHARAGRSSLPSSSTRGTAAPTAPVAPVTVADELRKLADLRGSAGRRFESDTRALAPALAPALATPGVAWVAKGYGSDSGQCCRHRGIGDAIPGRENE